MLQKIVQTPPGDCHSNHLVTASINHLKAMACNNCRQASIQGNWRELEHMRMEHMAPCSQVYQSKPDICCHLIRKQSRNKATNCFRTNTRWYNTALKSTYQVMLRHHHENTPNHFYQQLLTFSPETHHAPT